MNDDEGTGEGTQTYAPGCGRGGEWGERGGGHLAELDSGPDIKFCVGLTYMSGFPPMCSCTPAVGCNDAQPALGSCIPARLSIQLHHMVVEWLWIGLSRSALSSQASPFAQSKSPCCICQACIPFHVQEDILPCGTTAPRRRGSQAVVQHRLRAKHEHDYKICVSQAKLR